MVTKTQHHDMEQLAGMLTYGLERAEKLCRRLRPEFPTEVDALVPLIEQAHECLRVAAELANAATPNLHTPRLQSAGGDKPKGGRN